ncbi:MAG TPA: type II secretion system protein [Polyangiaceae bacterium]|nr:type II secretion system protein [Polyangiaceae bacterium]
MIDRDTTKHPSCEPAERDGSFDVARLAVALRRARSRRQSAGVTLVEVLIVVAIMALLASGVTFAILPKYKEAQVSTAKTSAQVMRRAVQDWQRVNNEVTCPSVSQLIEGKHIDSGAEPDDPWGMPWNLVCTDDEVFVQSNGPDKKQGTADDISVPKLRADEG